MVAIIRWIVSLLVAVAAILFAVANREAASVVWSPLHAPVELPLFVWVLGGTLIGFVLGGFMVWLNGAAVRRERRRQRKIIRTLEKELDDTKQQKADASGPTLRIEQELPS